MPSSLNRSIEELLLEFAAIANEATALASGSLVSIDEVNTIIKSGKFDIDCILDDVGNIESIDIPTPMISDEMVTFFDPEGYTKQEQRVRVIDKLTILKKLVTSFIKENNNVGDSKSEEDLSLIDTCFNYINDGWALTPKMIDLLNTIYKSYE